MRKYLRARARANMKRAGIRKMNKKRYSINPNTGIVMQVPSFFADNWRKWADG